MNFLRGVVQGGALQLPDYADQTIPLGRIAGKVQDGEELVAGIRPEHFAEGGSGRLSVTAEIVEHLGGETFVYAGSGSREVLTVGLRDGRKFRSGDRFEAEFDPARLLFFAADGSRLR